MSKPFEGIFGGACELKILEHLISLDDFKFNITELSEEAKVSRITGDRIIKKFLRWGIVKISNVKNNIKYYQINMSSPLVKSIVGLNNTIIELMLGDDKLQEIHEYFETH